MLLRHWSGPSLLYSEATKDSRVGKNHIAAIVSKTVCKKEFSVEAVATAAIPPPLKSAIRESLPSIFRGLDPLTSKDPIRRWPLFLALEVKLLKFHLKTPNAINITYRTHQHVGSWTSCTVTLAGTFSICGSLFLKAKRSLSYDENYLTISQRIISSECFCNLALTQ